VSRVAVAPPPPSLLRESLAEGAWSAALWHSSPDAESGRAKAYERLYDAVLAAPDDGAALSVVRAALADGTAELGDLTAGSLGGLALAGITAGGDAGTEDAVTIPGVGK
jgi:hypothetical protein